MQYFVRLCLEKIPNKDDGQNDSPGRKVCIWVCLLEREQKREQYTLYVCACSCSWPSLRPRGGSSRKKMMRPTARIPAIGVALQSHSQFKYFQVNNRLVRIDNLNSHLKKNSYKVNVKLKHQETFLSQSKISIG